MAVRSDLNFAGVFADQPAPVLVADATGRIVAASRAAEDLLGHPPGGLAGLEITSMMEPTPRDAHLPGFRNFLTSGTRRQPEDALLHGRARRADGTELEVDLTIATHGEPGGPDFLVLAALTDATERAGYERQANFVAYLRAGLEVARAVASAAGLADAYKAVLPALGDRLGHDMARLWLVRPDGRELVCVDWWTRTDEVRAVAPSPFGITCPPGVGLAGECWAAGGALTVTIDAADPLFPNQPMLAEHGVHSAAAAPLEGGTGAVGVLALYYGAERPLDAGTLDLLIVLGEAVGAVLEAKQRDAAAQEQLRRSQLLLDASSAVASAGDYEDTLRMLAASAVPGLGDLCLIDLVRADGGLERVAAVHADRSKIALVEELKRYYSPEFGSAHPAGSVITSGESVFSPTMSDEFLRDSTRDSRHLEIVRELGFDSYVCVPLRAGAEVLGAITLISAGSGRRFSEEDVALAEQLAEQVAGTVARARQSELELHRAAERQVRSAALVELGTALSAADSVEQALDALLASEACALGANAARIALPDELRKLLRIRHAGEASPAVRERYETMALSDMLPTAEAVRRNRRIVIANTDQAPRRFAIAMRETAQDVGATVVEPLRAADGSVLGALGLSWDEAREFTAPELGMIEEVAAAFSRALPRIIVAEREHEIATSLQERLLAMEATSAAAVISVVYEPAGGVTRVGGDWYTVSALGDTRVGVSVGDVVGHGLQAVTTMSQLRSALATAALAAADPAAVIALLDRYARDVPDACCATVAYAVIDAEHARVEYTCAGHPYPMVVRPGGEVVWLTGGRRPPLDTETIPGPPTAATDEFPPGSLLVLFSDGLVERPGESLEVGLARLAAAAATCADLPVGAVGDALLSAMVGAHHPRDDVAIVAVRPVGTTERTLVESLPASLEAIPRVRGRLRAWLRGLDLDEQRAYGILLAVGEAVNNAIEHGSGLDPRKTVGVEAFAGASGQLSVTVSNSGRWSGEPSDLGRDPYRGHGLKLMRGLSDEVKTVCSAIGTRVTMRFGPDTLGQ